jgi:hypothetical protein
MMDDKKVQRGLLLAEIEEAEGELQRLCAKAASLAGSLRDVGTVLEEMRPTRGTYQHEAAEMRAAMRERVRTQSKYRDAMDFNAAIALIAEIEAMKRKCDELLARKSDSDFRQLRAV